MLKDNLKALRESKGLTKKQVAQGVGINERAYIAYEYGERDVSTETLSKLADFYGVSIDYLLGRTPVKRMATEETDPFADIDVSELDKRIIKKYTEFNEDERMFCIEMLKQFTTIFDDEKQATEPKPPIMQSAPQSPPQPDIQISQNSEQKTYPIPTAARKGINGKYFSGNVENMTEDEINYILNAEDGDENL